MQIKNKELFLPQISKPLTRNKALIQELECQLTIERQLIGELSAKLSLLEEKISRLEDQNSLLEQELSLYRTRKNSRNSSIPPSQDPYRIKRTESLRERSGRRAGGQPGHEGSCLEAVSDPTSVVKHQPNFCQCCGDDLSGVSPEFLGKRQVIDLPPIRPVVTEHQIYGKRCLCGHLTESDYPQEAHSPVCYGPRLEGLTAYFHSRQYIPYERMRELYGDIFGLSISSGSLVKMVESFAGKSQGLYVCLCTVQV